MSTTNEYIKYICEQINGVGEIRYKKMFGEFMVYVNDKPVIIVCNNVPFVKKLECITEKMQNAEIGFPPSTFFIFSFNKLYIVVESRKLLEKNLFKTGKHFI